MSCPPPVDLPNPGIEPTSPTLQADSLTLSQQGNPGPGFPRVASQENQTVKNLPAVQETQVQFLGLENPLEKEMATHSSILAWGNPIDRGAWQATVHGIFQEGILEWAAISFSRGSSQPRDRPLSLMSPALSGGFFTTSTAWEEPACQCLRRRRERFGFNLWVGKIPWRRKWQPTLVFLPGKSPWIEGPGGLQSVWSQKVGHD